MILKSEAIKKFLIANTHKDLADQYNIGMECQVNVAQDGGERVGGDYKGRKWVGWTNGLITWKSFRIPYKASTEPEYIDSEIKFPLEEHVEAIGMTGWDWQHKLSKWVAYDFDAITNHTTGLTTEDLEKVISTANQIPWVTIRRSTSGQGIHLYVKLPNIDTKNHTEHAALARAILGIMSAITGFDFKTKVDACGGNMWVWHRKMIGTKGLEIIKDGSVLYDIPLNWRDHVAVIKGTRNKILPQDILENNTTTFFEELSGQRTKIQLDDEHKKLIDYLKTVNAYWWWDSDNHMLVTHTIYLKEAHIELGFKGFFDTLATGKDRGTDINCFAYPIRRGGWSIRRFTQGVQEHESWVQDASGWTQCYFNRDPDFKIACRIYGGLEDPSGGFIFREAELAMKAAALMGITIDISSMIASRKTKLKLHKDGRIIAEINHDPNDLADKMPGWLVKKGDWIKMFNIPTQAPIEPEIGNYDDIIRHLVTENQEDYGWMVKTDDKWQTEPLSHIKIALASLGLNQKDITNILGSSVFKCWKVVNKPFQPEYPGDREWNRNAAQLRFLPTSDIDNLSYPTWLSILQHCGSGLDEYIKKDSWCLINGITTGADYLKCWIASLFQCPSDPLPYLFFYGPQNSGKSIFHEALGLLLTKGYQRADLALTSVSGFNGELEGAIICVVEETDLNKNRMAYNRIKDWVTSRHLNIRYMYKTPYHIPNTTHWIQCSNSHTACPIFSGDTRITMCYVESLDPIQLIPKKRIIQLLEKEAADFLASILSIEIPESRDRLNVPALETDDKHLAEKINQSDLERFIDEKCVAVDGYSIKVSDFYERFTHWLDPNEIGRWSKKRVGVEFSPQYPRGRDHGSGQFYIGNIAWLDDDISQKRRRFKAINGYLEIIND